MSRSTRAYLEVCLSKDRLEFLVFDHRQFCSGREKIEKDLFHE